jgi:type II secretory pathway predicted ATPase ExeA
VNGKLGGCSTLTVPRIDFGVDGAAAAVAWALVSSVAISWRCGRGWLVLCVEPDVAMYHKFFGLQKEPFGMTPDPSFLFLLAAHREALAGLTYAILSRTGFAVLTGDAGTGKTTLLTRVVKSVPESRARFSVVLNPTLTPSEF